ncbi:RHS repeat-associated core domain-containing protein [Hymenobacter baengnokdamensis]|uniref:RHS repeat-associated core domain-containing protein n=1 Tax=Hymenobacter baengnokdamensis TaxID=2615203 RepID=UPI00178422C2|nr:RHS repeat-associated core domain-containing protein [Hymenobacter baengnokdamensis]
MTIRQPQQGLLVTQEQHYYPFGLPLSGVAVNTLAQPQVSKEQFNGGSTVDDALLGSEGGVYSTFYRNYDPTTGRFQGVDPLADSYADSSPYAFSSNDPVNFNDPAGDEPIYVDGRLMNPRDIATGKETWSGSDLDYSAYQLGGPDVRTGDGSGGYLGSYREYDPNNGTYANIQVNGKWVSPYYYETIKIYASPVNTLSIYTPYLNAYANQVGYPVGFKVFVDIIMSEASTRKDAAGIGSVLINRMNAVGTNLNNPNWINRIGTKSQYQGFTNGQYKKAKGMSLSEIQNDPDFKFMYQGAVEAYDNWGTDFTGMPDGHPSYYWNAAGYNGGGPALELYRKGKAILNTIDGTDFYSFKNPRGIWTPK